MGACFSSTADGKGVPLAPQGPFHITIAFPSCSPFNLTVSPNDKIGNVRNQVVAEMERRAAAGENFCKIEGKLVTVDGDTGDNLHLRDSMTVAEAELEPKQYLWFQDKNEDTRVQNLLLRSSRLTENTSHNSRGVKQGMAMIKEEDEGVEGAY